MKPLPKFLILATLSMLCGCGEQKADVTTAKTHQSDNISFDYPKNWRITEDYITPEIQYLFIETPGEAFVMLQSFQLDLADTLLEQAKEFSELASGEMKIGEMVVEKFKEIEPARGYEWISEEFNVNLLSVSIPHKRLYGGQDVGSRRLFLMLQVATEDFDKVHPGFVLISDTLQVNEPEPSGTTNPVESGG